MTVCANCQKEIKVGRRAWIDREHYLIPEDFDEVFCSKKCIWEFLKTTMIWKEVVECQK